MIRLLQPRTTLGLAGLLVLSLGYQLWAQQRGPDAQGGLTPPPRPSVAASAASSKTSGRPFSVGESLSFNVSWASFADAARLEIEVVDQGAFFGHESLRLQSHVQTTGQARSIFLELDNQYVSYVHQSTMLPHRLETSIKQGARRADETVIIDQQGRTARRGDDTSIALESECFDLTSLVYALRMRELSVGSKARFTALYGKEVWQIDSEAKEVSRIQTQTGSYEALAIDLWVKGKSKYRVRIWLSNDKLRLPVLIAAKLPFGDVRAELSSIAFNPRPKEILAKEKFAEGPKGSAELFAALERSRPFSVGERLNYMVSWAGFASIGTASFAVRQRGWIDEKRVMELVGDASTSGLARSLIDVDDQLISLVDVKTLHPLRTETRLSEGTRKKQVTASYNWKDASVRLTNGTQIPVTPGTLDLISLFYSIRASELTPGAAYGYTLLDANHRPVSLTVKRVKQELIAVPFGTLPAQQIDVLDVEARQIIAQVWISDDARRIPLYLAVRTRFGELKFFLSSAVGLR